MVRFVRQANNAVSTILHKVVQMYDIPRSFIF